MTYILEGMTNPLMDGLQMGNKLQDKMQKMKICYFHSFYKQVIPC